MNWTESKILRGFFKYLAITPPKFLVFLPLLTWDHVELNLLFSRSPANRSWITCYKLETSLELPTFRQSLCCCVSHSESLPDHLMTSSETFKLQTRIQTRKIHEIVSTSAKSSEDILNHTFGNILDWQLSGLKYWISSLLQPLTFFFSFVSIKILLIKYCIACN